jgi:hypothetical protein
MKFETKHFVGFLAAFAVGCVLVYASPVEHKTVFVYPTPLNFKQLNYKNANGECYRFSKKEVECTPDAKSIPAEV